MHIEGVAERPEIVAVAQSADHINHVETHRRRADIRAPGLILPAYRDAGSPVGLVLATAGTGDFPAGSPVWRIAAVAFRREATGIHIDQVGAQEHASIGERRLHMQHRGVRFKIGIAAGTARTPEIMFEGDVKILLAIEIRGVAADPALQPVIAAVVAGQAGKGIVILRADRGHARSHHGIFITLQRHLRLAAPGLESGGIT